jgi:hypothetical protein
MMLSYNSVKYMGQQVVVKSVQWLSYEMITASKSLLLQFSQAISHVTVELKTNVS